MKHPVEVRLLEALVPPPDFDLLCLVGTTYSLSPTVFLAIVSAASLDWSSRGGSVGTESLTKEEWRSLLIEKRHDCLMFVDHHGPLEIGAGGLRPLETVAMDQVIKRHGRDTGRGGSLHSKLIVALYRNSKNSVIGRLFVGSKNFTRANMQEFGVVYDLRPKLRATGNDAFTRSLISYLEYLRDEEGAGTRRSRLSPLSRAIEGLRDEHLCVTEESCQFHWQGRGRRTKQPTNLADQLQYLLRKKWDAIFVHSPWTRQSAVRYIAEPLKDVPIHIACLKEPGLSTLKQRNVHYQLSYSSSGLVQSHQSHAKVYLFSRGNDSVLVFGSANLTPDGWGIQAPGFRPNAEILVSATVKATNYRYLSEIGGHPEDIASSKPEPSVQEQVLSLLNGIEVSVSYDRRANELSYEIRQRGELGEFQKNIVIFHELIEPIGEKSSTSLLVCDSWPLPEAARLAWPKRELFKISSLVRIACPAYSVETHLIVDLDSDFYEGRANLRALQYKAQELLDSLAQLMNVVIPSAPPQGNGSGNDPQARLAALLDGLRLERYAYKMLRLKAREPNAFRKTIERVNKLLAAARNDEELLGNWRFGKLIEAVEAIHVQLVRT